MLHILYNIGIVVLLLADVLLLVTPWVCLWFLSNSTYLGDQ